jgi:hypothetical protein
MIVKVTPVFSADYLCQHLDYYDFADTQAYVDFGHDPEVTKILNEHVARSNKYVLIVEAGMDIINDNFVHMIRTQYYKYHRQTAGFDWVIVCDVNEFIEDVSLLCQKQQKNTYYKGSHNKNCIFDINLDVDIENEPKPAVYGEAVIKSTITPTVNVL